MNEQTNDNRSEVLGELYRRKARHESTQAFVTTTAPLVMRKWNGCHPVDDNIAITPIPEGSTLKIVMVSRLGDFGLTDDLDAEFGYGLRLDCASEEVTNFRFERTPTTQTTCP